MKTSLSFYRDDGSDFFTVFSPRQFAVVCIFRLSSHDQSIRFSAGRNWIWAPPGATSIARIDPNAVVDIGGGVGGIFHFAIDLARNSRRHATRRTPARRT